MIYVITSNLNGWDNLRSPLGAAMTTGVRWICYTNIPHHPAVEPWEFRPVFELDHPSRTARVPKILPHLMLPDDAEYSIWHDANFQLAKPPQVIISECLKDHDWAAHVHPGRACCFAEGEHCITAGIGTAGLIREELLRYHAGGHPRDAGLWANGFLVRRHTPAVAALCEQWWRLYTAGGERDQISFPVARRQVGLEIHTIPASYWSSPYVQFHFHAAWVTRSNNESYLPERSLVREKLARLAEMTGSGGGIQWPAQ